MRCNVIRGAQLYDLLRGDPLDAGLVAEPHASKRPSAALPEAHSPPLGEGSALAGAQLGAYADPRPALGASTASRAPHYTAVLR